MYQTTRNCVKKQNKINARLLPQYVHFEFAIFNSTRNLAGFLRLADHVYLSVAIYDFYTLQLHKLYRRILFQPLTPNIFSSIPLICLKIQQIPELCNLSVALRLRFTLSGVFSFPYVARLIRIRYPKTYMSMESL